MNSKIGFNSKNSLKIEVEIKKHQFLKCKRYKIEINAFETYSLRFSQE